MISNKLKQILKDHADDLKNNNLDSVFKDLHSEYLMQELKNLLVNQGIDVLEYITRIPNRYYQCDNFNTFNLSSYVNIKSIGALAFYSSHIDTLILPQSIKELENQAFNSASIENLSLPEGVEEIPYACFYRFRIPELKIPNSVWKIGDIAFEKAEIDILYLSDNLEEVSKYAFKQLDCDKIIYKGRGFNSDSIIDILKINGVEII